LNRDFGNKNVTHFLTHSLILGGYSRNSPNNRGNVVIIAIKHQWFEKKKWYPLLDVPVSPASGWDVACT